MRVSRLKSPFQIKPAQITKNFDAASLDEFPPKRLTMSQEQLEKRRLALQRYLHSGAFHSKIKCMGKSVLT